MDLKTCSWCFNLCQKIPNSDLCGICIKNSVARDGELKEKLEAKKHGDENYGCHISGEEPINQ